MPTVADQLLAQLDPFTQDDSANLNSLATFLAGIAQMYEEVSEWADDDDDGNVGWSILLDLNRAPSKALPWLGQFVGAEVDPNLSDADQRAQILDVKGWARGSVDAMTNAAMPYLTGNKTVLFSERDSGASLSDPAYGLIVYTRTSETPDPDSVLKALLKIKPAGIVLLYKTVAGWVLEDAFLNEATYNTIFTTFHTYGDFLLGENVGGGTSGLTATYGSAIYGVDSYGG